MTDLSKHNRKEIVGYGFTYGQVEVIKMQFYRFSHTYREIAKHYKSRADTIRRLIESSQFADIQPLGGFLDE